MIYQGSKNKISKELIPIIQKFIDDNDINTYIEPFVGGANVVDKIKCKCKIGYDSNSNLISLLNYAKSDPELTIAPDDCPFDHYKDVRENQYTGKYSNEYVALIGYMASYGGRYFDGGYGRDRTGKRNIYKERVINFKNQIPYLQDVEFKFGKFEQVDWSQYHGCLFYFDPPYKGTKQYDKNMLNYNMYYDIIKHVANNGNIVLCSEYYMPQPFKCIWEKKSSTHQKSNRENWEQATEKLFTLE